MSRVKNPFSFDQYYRPDGNVYDNTTLDCDNDVITTAEDEIKSTVHKNSVRLANFISGTYFALHKAKM